MKTILQRRWLWGLMVFFAIGIAIIAVVPYLTFNPSNFSPVFEGRFPDSSVFWLYMHVITGGIALLVGSFQFWKWLRNKHRNVHRLLGRIYMFLGIFPASVSGLVIAQDTVAGLSGALGFSLMAIAWFITGAISLYAILNKNVHTHRRWMIRNFSLTLAAVTLRLWLPILIVSQIGVGIESDPAFMTAYQIVPWLSWIPNLIIAEWIIHILMPRRQSQISTLATEQ